MAIEEYEVYYYQNGRWHVHARFEAAEREIAIEEAKSVETKLGFPARVIRETYDPESNTTEETVTYQGQRAKSIADADTMFGPSQQSGKQGEGPPSRGSGGGRSAPAATKQTSRGGSQKTGRKESSPQKRTTRQKAANALIQVLTGFAMSLVIAVIGSFAVALILLQMLEADMIPAGNRNALVFGTFILLFFGSGFIYLNKHFNLSGLFKSNRAQKRGPAPQTIPAAKAKQKKPVPTNAADLANADLDALARSVKEEDGDIGAPELDGDGFESEKSSGKEKSEKGGEKDKDKKDKAAKKEEERKKKEAEKKAKQAEEKKKADAKKKKDTEKKKSPVDAVKPDFLRFLTDAFTSIQQDHPKLNTFSKFGMNLYMCGGCSTICQSKGISDDLMQGLLKEGLGLIGTNAERAQSFCDEIPTYGNTPRYAGIINAGGQAMTNFLGGQGSSNAGLSGLLTEWNLPEKRSSVPTMFTFLFTDIVGSTAMTQRLGNAPVLKKPCEPTTMPLEALYSNSMDMK